MSKRFCFRRLIAELMLVATLLLCLGVANSCERPQAARTATVSPGGFLIAHGTHCVSCAADHFAGRCGQTASVDNADGRVGNKGAIALVFEPHHASETTKGHDPEPVVETFSDVAAGGDRVSERQPTRQPRTEARHGAWTRCCRVVFDTST